MFLEVSRMIALMQACGSREFVTGPFENILQWLVQEVILVVWPVDQKK